MPAAETYFERLLKVKRLTNTISTTTTTTCDVLTPTQLRKTNGGYSADLVLIVTAETNSVDGWIAWAYACNFDSVTTR